MKLHRIQLNHQVRHQQLPPPNYKYTCRRLPFPTPLFTFLFPVKFLPFHLVFNHFRGVENKWMNSGNNLLNSNLVYINIHSHTGGRLLFVEFLENQGAIAIVLSEEVDNFTSWKSNILQLFDKRDPSGNNIVRNLIVHIERSINILLIEICSGKSGFSESGIEGTPTNIDHCHWWIRYWWNIGNTTI